MWQAKRGEVDQSPNQSVFTIDYTNTDTGETFTGKYSAPYLTDEVMEQQARAEMQRLTLADQAVVEHKLTYAKGDVINATQGPPATNPDLAAYLQAKRKLQVQVTLVSLGLKAPDDAAVSQARELALSLMKPEYDEID